MGKLDQARKRWQEVKSGFQPTIRRVRGILGNGSGVVRVPNRPDLVYVRVNADASTIWQVPNDAVNDIDNLPVIVEKEPDGGLWRVVEVFRGQISYSGAGWDGVKLTPQHGDEHEWPPRQPGPDPVSIYTRALTDLRSEPTATYSLKVNVQPIRYNYDGLTKYFKGTTLDLSSYVPGSGIRQVATYLDVRMNTAYAIPGAPVTYSANADPPVPRLPWYAKPSGLVTLRQNQIEITESDFETVRLVVDDVGVAHNLTAPAAPTVNDDYSKGYSETSMWVFGSTIYVCTSPALGAANWVNVTEGGTSLPVVDTTSIVKGSVDDTKKARFEVDGLTTSTTRVLTVQDVDGTILVTGGSDVAVADGGTGASTAQAAIDALTAVSGATNEHVLTKDTATGNAIFKAAAGGGATLEFIEKSVLSVAAATMVLGGSTSIPGTYIALKLIADLRSAQSFFGTGDGLLMHFNNDTGNNYATSSSKIINGTSSLTTANLTAPALHLGEIEDASSFATLTFSPVEILIMDYAITTKNTSVKSETLLQGGSVSTSGPTWGGGQWRLTPRVAITKITLKTSSGSNLDAGCTAYLYGVKDS